jgi:hypothetical protein
MFILNVKIYITDQILLYEGLDLPAANVTERLIGSGVSGEAAVSIYSEKLFKISIAYAQFHTFMPTGKRILCFDMGLMRRYTHKA